MKVVDVGVSSFSTLGFKLPVALRCRIKCVDYEIEHIVVASVVSSEMLDHGRQNVRAGLLSAFRRNFYRLPEIYPAPRLSQNDLHPKVFERHVVCAGVQCPRVF